MGVRWGTRFWHGSGWRRVADAGEFAGCRDGLGLGHMPRRLWGCVASGRYQSISEAVREAVRLLEDQQALRQAEIERARALIRERADQLADGRTVDGEAIFKEWDAELEADAQRTD